MLNVKSRDKYDCLQIVLYVTKEMKTERRLNFFTPMKYERLRNMNVYNLNVS